MCYSFPHVNLVVTGYDKRLHTICHILIIARTLLGFSNLKLCSLTLYIYAASYSIHIVHLTCRFIGCRNLGTFHPSSLHMTIEMFDMANLVFIQLATILINT